VHEHSLMQNLLTRIHQLAAAENRVPIAVTIQLGALAHISASHFREHFEQETTGTTLQGTRLEIQELADIYHPQAQDIVLKSLTFETADDH